MSYDDQLKELWDAYISKYVLPSGIEGIEELVERVEHDSSLSCDKYRPGFLIAWKKLALLAEELDKVTKFLMVAYFRSMEETEREGSLKDDALRSEFFVDLG